ncbi:hypothetical protein EDM57_19640 [Brevibacillus gelatini]|uniref:Uncharacterized protein n=1 Tax=Brevibacillus gelatini TaxID=1655277 RepID=A0A3M8AQZ4_9BACL|nr:hypothetical protein [Brevibacillus gelatini]RNB53509.1 hypothetical protein EDM57_19640 [Brevibacillus gelatini]
MFRLVDSTDINSWSNRRDAQERLPQLLRRLIHATVNSPKRISFPAGESVQIGGWDGILEVSEGNAFVPTGISVWELGTNRDVKAKANSDYEKRTNDSLGIDKKVATFVFVTSRRWSGKDEWMREKQEEKIWADVRAYDADDIEQWLEIAPAVNVWLGHLIGKRPEYSQDLESFWDEWKNATNPPFASEFLLIGRTSAIEKLKEWIVNPPTGLAVKADSSEEALAFFASYLYTLPEEKRTEIFSKCVVAYDLNVFRTLVANNDQLILIPMFSDAPSVGIAIQKGHHVYVPLGRDTSTTSTSLILPPFNRKTLEQALVQTGFSEAESRVLAMKSKGSISVLRRLLSVVPELNTPLWARPGEARALIPFLLGGAWNNSNMEDRKIIAHLARRPYDEVMESFIRWANEPDAPVKKIGEICQLTSREDSWKLLSKYIESDDIIRLREVVLEVLGEVDPSYDLEKEERFMASIYNKVLPHSSYLRKGLSETLALLASSGIEASFGERVRGIAWELFRKANDWKFWASVSDVLPILAEADPEAFLHCLEESINSDTFNMHEIFRQETTWGGCTQSGLLWALETCAWNPVYLGKVSLLLAKLDTIDPGGTYSNRPFRSLKEIFLCWHPSTTASLSKRFEVIDALLRYEPDTAWKLLCNLLPSIHEIAWGTRRPEWKEWANGFEYKVTKGECQECTYKICEKLITHVDYRTSRWVDIIENIDSLPEEFCNQVIVKLSQLDPTELDSNLQKQIWDAIREKVARHREFSDAKWALAPEITNKLYNLYLKFEPADDVSKYGWLFSWHPNHPDCVNKDWEMEQEAIKEIQLKAIHDILERNDVYFIIKLSEYVERPSLLGFIAGKNVIVQTEVLSLLNSLLGSEQKHKSELASGLVWALFQEQGWTWVENVLINTADVWNDLQKAEFLRYLPFTKRTWDLVENSGLSIKGEYWLKLPTTMRANESEFEIAVNQFLQYGRPCAAFFVISMLDLKDPSVNLSADIINKILEEILTQEPNSQDWLMIKNSFDYHLAELLNYLTALHTDEDIISKFEWLYLPFLTHSNRQPRSLHKKLSKDPAFFAEVIEAIYKPEGDTTQEEELPPDEFITIRAKLAYDLIKSWKQVPGLGDDNSIDYDFLCQWVKEARERCTQLGRRKYADSAIGRILAYAPIDKDGIWPHQAVRELIEQMQNSDIERSIEIGIYNKRGVFTKSIGEGGLQERELASKYYDYAHTLESKWIRTASILRRVAEKYEAEARSEDIRAELEYE